VIFFPQGITITQAEHLALLHVEAAPEQWMSDLLVEKAVSRGLALIAEWRPKLLSDPDVTELPADANALTTLIMSRPDYRSRAQADLAEGEVHPLHNIVRFADQKRHGSSRIGNQAGPTTLLFPTGIPLSDLMCNCILAYVVDLEDWILGALLGHINRGSKKMIAQYYPLLMSDPDVETTPATEDGLIMAITARPGYKTLQEELVAAKA
jgi:hypothetical protein